MEKLIMDIAEEGGRRNGRFFVKAGDAETVAFEVEGETDKDVHGEFLPSLDRDGLHLRAEIEQIDGVKEGVGEEGVDLQGERRGEARLPSVEAVERGCCVAVSGSRSDAVARETRGASEVDLSGFLEEGVEVDF
jgi:hypothetical protein